MGIINLNNGKITEDWETSKRITIIVTGLKWFDKVNGNTYHNAKVIEITTKGTEIFDTGYDYGYGSSYFDDVIKHYTNKYGSEKFLEMRRSGKLEIIDNGSIYTTKTKCKNCELW